MNQNLSALLKPSDSGGDRQRRADATATQARDWRSRSAAALPWLMLLGFFAMLATVFGTRLLPATELTIATVVTVRQGIDAVAGAEKIEGSTPSDAPMLFQASGWVEPEPYPMLATALIDGVVNTVEVLEGDKVELGQVLATLIDDDARLNLETAKSQLASLEAKAKGHYRLLAILEARQASLAKQVAVAEARVSETADLVERLEKIERGGVSEREKAKSRLELATLKAEVEALAVTELELEAEIQQVHEVHIDFEARIEEAKTEVARKQLMLDRTSIESPIDGRVLRLLAAPGQKKMLNMDAAESATIAILYDPQQLQARIDVPLAEAAQLAVGQPVRLRSELLPEKVFAGRVTRIVGEADLQRNTLQAKVAIQNPDERLRPDMLCRAEFLPMRAGESSAEAQSATSAPVSASGGGRVRIFVPVAALTGGDATQAGVWKVDGSGDHVVQQSIRLGDELRGDHRLVIDGLKPGDRVVLDPPADIHAGQRFRPAASVRSTNSSTSS